MVRFSTSEVTAASARSARASSRERSFSQTPRASSNCCCNSSIRFMSNSFSCRCTFARKATCSLRSRLSSSRSCWTTETTSKEVCVTVCLCSSPGTSLCGARLACSDAWLGARCSSLCSSSTRCCNNVCVNSCCSSSWGPCGCRMFFCISCSSSCRCFCCACSSCCCCCSCHWSCCSCCNCCSCCSCCSCGNVTGGKASQPVATDTEAGWIIPGAGNAQAVGTALRGIKRSAAIKVCNPLQTSLAVP
mmetsp:Transcript_24834/g.45572  ORF Transcript_24834/g.45572 Transcript_24834/m.45572 type:complete len:247 (-) Transcript_24834:37-777(-)